MNIHIVCRDVKEDRILARLSQVLADGIGWSLSASPDPRADLNYFIVYIDYAERFSDWHLTPTAAYFSHYEVDNLYKRVWWKNADQAIDIRVITSDHATEFLEPGKPIIKVTPPIDGQFMPLNRKVNEIPRIGFSGFVDPRSNRKGADLVKQLMDEFAGKWSFCASGSGWPCRTRMYPFSELPVFYNSLDAFVCTSSIEGIPMPPLEALACGVPVVIPVGVGMLDDLPTSPGLYRYFPSNRYEPLREALQSLLSTSRAHSGELVQSVARFTPSQWCADHLTGFAEALSHPVQLTVESDRHGNRGVLYVAYGKPARQCAQGAMASFRRNMSEVPIALVSDVPLGSEDVFVSHADEDIGGRSAKTLIDSLAPADWQYIMYLDADTEVVAPIDFLFQLVEDGFDLVICKNPGKYHTARQMIRSDNRDECDATFRQIGTDELLQLNGGVFVYSRNPRTQLFFQTWHVEWAKYGKRDQGALLRALFQVPLKIFVLGNEWNTITRYDPPERSAGILHYPMTARRWRGVLHERSDSPDAWKKVREYERGNLHG